MPNQYNAADFANVPLKSGTTNFGDGYPIPSASGIGGGNAVSVATTGVFPTSANTAWTIVFNDDAAASLNTRPKPNRSGLTGSSNAPVSSGISGGTLSAKVIDHIDAPFNNNTDPNLQSNP